MTKHLFTSIALLLFLGNAYHCQSKSSVGINTEAPSATLSVKSLETTDSSKNLELQNSNNNILLNVKNSGDVGIGHDSQSAALDIKTSASETLRLTTKPEKVDPKSDYVYYVGQSVGNGYNLRTVNTKDILSILSVNIPVLKRIIVTNFSSQRFEADLNTNAANGTINEFNLLWGNKDGKEGNLSIDHTAYNSGDDLFVFIPEHTNDATLLDNEGRGGSIKFLKDGIFEIKSWINLTRMVDGKYQFLLSLAKKGVGESTFKNYKRAPFGRVKNGKDYINVGKSFAFVEHFKAGEELKIRIAPAPIKENDHIKYAFTLAPKTVWLSVTNIQNATKN